MDELSLFNTVGFIRVDVSAVIAEVKARSRAWVEKYCTISFDHINE